MKREGNWTGRDPDRSAGDPDRVTTRVNGRERAVLPGAPDGERQPLVPTQRGIRSARRTLLGAELERIYPQLQQKGGLQSWFGRRLTCAARQVHTLFIEVNEVTDKTENAMKVAGDVSTARLFTLVAARLGLDHWKGSVREKLKTLDDIYRFAVEQTAMARGELLDLSIVLILVLELVLFFAGIMR